MTASLDYPTATAGQLAAALARREVSAMELFEAAVAAIEAKDGPINAVVVRDFGRARDAAKAADAAIARGERRPLLGVPITVKESHHVLGLPTTRGLMEFKNWKPSYPSVSVQRLVDAGAVLLGKTNVPPRLADWQSDNPVYGRTNNPRDLSRSPGGSSGGSAAAVAAGMVPLECGSDIGGSIRVPAAFCGVFGHKPSYGLISPIGNMAPPATEPAQPGEMTVVGPLARTASDLELALDVMMGPAGDDAVAYRVELPKPRAVTAKELRVLILCEHPACETDAEVAAAPGLVGERLARAGAQVAYESSRLPDLGAAHTLYATMLDAIMTLGVPGVVPISAHAWFAALNQRMALRHRWRELFEDFDVVIAPTFGTTAFEHVTEPSWTKRTLTINGQPTPYGVQSAWPGVASLVNLPATAVPVATSREGLPIAVQIIGPYLEDRTTLAVAGMLERGVG